MTMIVVVIGWQVYGIARSDEHMSIKAASFQLGLIGLVQFLPLLLMSPFTGLAADRFDRRRMAQTALLLDSMMIAVLGLATWGHHLTLMILFVGAAIHGLVRGFVGPPMSAMMANIVPRHMLPKSIALNSVGWQLASIFGPVAGGFGFAMAPALPYAVAVLLMVVAFIALQIMVPPPHERRALEVAPLTAMGEGFHYVWHHKMLLGCISLDLFAVLLGGATAMLPAYARDILHVGPEGLGWLRAAPGAGAALMALNLTRRPVENHVGIKMLAAVGVFGATTALFGISHNFVWSLFLLFILGGADMISVFIRGTLAQLYTPDDKRGRVNAISQVFISASNELGEAESGLLAALVGPVVAVVAGGLGAMLIATLWSRLFPVLRTTRTFTPPKEYPS